MCSVYKSATFATLFSVIKFNINTIILQDMELDTFAQKLRYLRLERNLNQHEFANLLIGSGFCSILPYLHFLSCLLLYPNFYVD